MQSGVLAKFDLKISTFKFCHFTLRQHYTLKPPLVCWLGTVKTSVRPAGSNTQPGKIKRYSLETCHTCHFKYTVKFCKLLQPGCTWQWDSFRKCPKSNAVRGLKCQFPYPSRNLRQKRGLKMHHFYNKKSLYMQIITKKQVLIHADFLLSQNVCTPL